MSQSAKLISLSTAVPVHVLFQDEVVLAAREMFGKRYSAFDRMAPVYQTAGIRKRQTPRARSMVFPAAWLERSNRSLSRSRSGAVRRCRNQGVVRRRADGPGSRCRGHRLLHGHRDAKPGSACLQDHGISSRYSARSGVRLGIAGGVSGFAIAARLAKAQPGANVLLVVVELAPWHSGWN